jgi:AmmeMemoRadiSam system protein B/AmmeMemoRadiSam system protein A
MLKVSPYSGSWYPECAADLEGLLEDRFEESRRRRPYLYPNGLGFVVPHAGPAYSGAVAAAVYRSLERQDPERVVVLAFPHQGGLDGVAAPDVDRIATPLGEAAIDPAFGGFPLVPDSRVCDHSFEIQLPFLQRAVPRSRITPLYVGNLSADGRAAAAETLAACWRPGVVFVASSDFTHYGRSFGFVPFPPDRAAAGRLQELDYECIEAAATLDSARFLETLERNRATVCGSGPIALLMETLRRLDGQLYLDTLDYRTSGELAGDYRHSVSYAALGWFPRPSFDLDEHDRAALLESAAKTLEELRAAGQRRAIPAAGGSLALQARRGMFVSLHQEQDLLGCVGNTSGRGPMAEEAADLTLAAALEDPRFRPAAQVSGPIHIEISALTPFRRIFDAAQCRVGTHGLFLKLGGHSGLLLPQVAAERGWQTEEFLEAVARKSGLGKHAWRDPKARLYVFEAEVF